MYNSTEDASRNCLTAGTGVPTFLVRRYNEWSCRRNCLTAGTGVPTTDGVGAPSLAESRRNCLTAGTGVPTWITSWGYYVRVLVAIALRREQVFRPKANPRACGPLTKVAIALRREQVFRQKDWIVEQTVFYGSQLPYGGNRCSDRY